MERRKVEWHVVPAMTNAVVPVVPSQSTEPCRILPTIFVIELIVVLFSLPGFPSIMITSLSLLKKTCW